MTEQEKQAIRDNVKFYTPCTDRETTLEEYVNELLNALDERDREIERYKELVYVLTISNNSGHEIIERLRNALKEIAEGNFVCHSGYCTANEVARQALAGEEK